MEPDALPPSRDHSVLELVGLLLAERFLAKAQHPLEIVGMEVSPPKGRFQPPGQRVTKQSLGLRPHIREVTGLRTVWNNNPAAFKWWSGLVYLYSP